ncbi:MAG: DUF4097 family beta strand repeat-containing protein [Myxococcota bacterium]
MRAYRVLVTALVLSGPATADAGKSEYPIEGVELVRVATTSGTITVSTSSSVKAVQVSSDSDHDDFEHRYEHSGQKHKYKKHKYKRKDKEGRDDEWDDFFREDQDDGERVNRRVRKEGKTLYVKYSSDEVDVVLPEGMNVELSSKSGDLKMRGKYGVVYGKTMSGDFILVGSAGKVDGGTLSGDVSVEAKASVLALVSISGDVSLKGSAKDVNVSSTSGDIGIYYLPEKLDAKTVSGEIRAKGLLSDTAVHTYETVSGELLLWLTGDEGFTVSANTFDSYIYVDGDRMERRADKRVGSGAATIRVKSMNGDVRIKREK